MTRNTNGENTVDVMNRHDASATPPQADVALAYRLIRDLVDAYPETLSVLGPLGIDLCCGGGHTLGEALDLHGLDREAILPRIASVVEAAQSRDR
jgi:iron-sulfur cluster repair protein YtfE (RIC family)